MKKLIHVSLSVLTALFMMAAVAMAQEPTQVKVRIEKDGKVVKDTTYLFERDADAENAVQVFEYNYMTALSGDHEGKAMVFVSKDGEKTEIKEMRGDSLVWISEEEGEDGPVKVMKYNVQTGDDSEGEHVVVVTSGEGGTFDVILEEVMENESGNNEKRIKVVVTEDEEGNTHVTKEALTESEEEVYVISGEESEKELTKIMEKVKEEHEDGDEVKVIVIKKKEKSKQ